MAETLSEEELREELLECARYGEEEDLRAILESGVDANYQDENGNTAMHRAAANGQVTCMAILKNFGADLRVNQQGNLPLHWAAQNGQAEAIRFLLDNFAEVDVLRKNEQGRSVLTEAFQSQNTDAIQLCLAHPSASEERLADGMQAAERETEETAAETEEGDAQAKADKDKHESQEGPQDSAE